MRRRMLAAFVAAALFGTGAWAQNAADSRPSRDAQGASPGGPAANSAGSQPASGMHGMHRSHMETLFTPQERAQFSEKMRAATTPEARAGVRNEYHQLAEQRAKEKGISLPPAAERRHGPRADRPAAALLSPEERTQMREKLRHAQTSEQRAELRKEYRALLEQRAREKGIELHEHGPGHRHRDRHGPRASA